MTAFVRPAAAADAEPRVGRVAFVEGQASYLNADADEWSAVDVNAPLVTGDRFWSGSDGRAEIQLPGGVYARLASDTEVELLEVSDQAVQVKVGVGTATFRLRQAPAGEHVEFSTPTTAVVARTRGAYRIDVAQDGQTTVTVRDGEADAYLGDDRYRLERGRGARIVNANYVTDDVPAVDVFDATQVPNDPWDDWEAQRAARLQGASSYKYVDADVYGAEDLDDYGTWDRHETYGPIWRPTQVAVGWSPFTQGRWVWQDPWGWTWVDYQPWGWAPSHYGRWVYVQDAWAWAPGPVVARPAYAPATVGFFGVSVNTPSVSVSVGIGPSVGWVPLGWGEPVVPWWGGVYGARRGVPWWGGWGGPHVVNNTVVKNINNINVTNINYTNLDRGFTAVSRDSFVRGDMQRIDLPRERMREAFRPLRGAPDVIPARDSLFAARPEKLRGGRGVKPSQEILQRAAVSTRDVPAARPDFARKLKLIERDKGAPVAPQQMRQLARESAPRGDAAPRVRTVAAKGRKPVVPEVTAEAPERLNAPLKRAARPGGAQDERAARRERAAEPPQREALQTDEAKRGAAHSPQDGQRGAALGERRMPQPGTDATRAEDPRSATREERAARRAARALPQDQREPQAQERSAAPSRDQAQRQRVEAAQQERQQRERMRAERTQPGTTPDQADGVRDRARTERALPGGQQERSATHDPAREQRQMQRTQQRDAAERAQADRARDAAQRGQAQRESAQRGQAQRESAQRGQAQRVGAQREQVKRDQAQREQAQRAVRAQQENARRQQAEQSRRESAQREQAASARRDAEARQQRQAAQAERSRQAGEARQRQAAAQRQREAAQAQRQQVQRQQARQHQAERQQAQRQQPAVERQGQASPQGEDPRRAERREKKQQRRAMPES